jgi:hypothetical protein
MENTDSSSNNMLPSKVNVNLNLFGALMLDRFKYMSTVLM